MKKKAKGKQADPFLMIIVCFLKKRKKAED